MVEVRKEFELKWFRVVFSFVRFIWMIYCVGRGRGTGVSFFLRGSLVVRA